eukprot:8682151-Pyramimonas_sp.AAC.1
MITTIDGEAWFGAGKSQFVTIAKLTLKLEEARRWALPTPQRAQPPPKPRAQEGPRQQATQDVVVARRGRSRGGHA